MKKERMLYYLDKLDLHLKNMKVQIELTSYNQRRLLLGWESHEEKGNTQLVLHSNPDAAIEAQHEIAIRHDLPENWLAEAAAGFLVENRSLEFKTNLPGEEGGLRLIKATRDYFLSMLCLLMANEPTAEHAQTIEEVIIEASYPMKSELEEMIRPLFSGPDIPRPVVAAISKGEFSQQQINPVKHHRPQTLREVSELRLQGDSHQFGTREFCDEFYIRFNAGRPTADMFADEPLRTGPFMDAFLAGIADHFCGYAQMAPPPWTLDETRFLKRPWFDWPSNKVKQFTIAESPAAFRRRLIFMGSNALSRARQFTGKNARHCLRIPDSAQYLHTSPEFYRAINPPSH